MCFCDDDPEARRIVREWPADRMVFGTDYFWRDEVKLMAWVKALRPDPAAQRLIFGANARRLLGLDDGDDTSAKNRCRVERERSNQ